MKKFESILIMSILIFIGFEILTQSQSIMSAVSFSLNIFKNNVFPSLFPFFILSSLLINYGFVEFTGNLFKGFMNKVFKVSGKGAFIFFMSIISGNPANAKYTRELYLKGDINKYEATKILCFSSFASPLFILGSVSMFLDNKEAAFLVLMCHYLGNIIIGVLLRNYHPSKAEEKSSFKKAIDEMHRKRISNKDGFGTIITNSLISGINTLLLILGVITVSLVLTTIINNNIEINSVFRSVINGFIEMTQGLKYIGMESIPLKLKSVLSVMILSFGGISVHLQIMSILNDTDINYLPFLTARIISSLISSVLLYVFFDFFFNL